MLRTLLCGQHCDSLVQAAKRMERAAFVGGPAILPFDSRHDCGPCCRAICGATCQPSAHIPVDCLRILVPALLWILRLLSLEAVCIPQSRRGGSVSGSTKDRVEKVKTAKEGLCDAKATCMKDVAFLCCTAWQAGAKRSKPLGNKDSTFMFARGKER